ncbi:dimethylaniline monooxygenase 5 [Trichonephila inaurata madagascariensis]|uniref:Flavin-containing monooxygenase n=1 Tax=Trichonephila inaurata madagascariensis TaxID=2747483 RepID=A0A8X6WX84_9ARAC|nr:dimethylaniline monooxygenase 5 [Trichonephila inaurata madagascariensis]
MNEESKKKICVIGGGSSGLTAIKCCKEENLEVVCYEKTDSFGGLWRFHADDADGRPSVMKTTVINTSKEMSAFSDFPPPKEFSNFMHNSRMLEYFNMYAENFDLLKHILYNHEVLSVKMTDDYASTGQWIVTVKNLDKNVEFHEIYDGVMVCAGHHIHPLIPRFEGLEGFGGTVLHSHSLKSSVGFEDKSVLVIGIGNSAVDAAVDLGKVTKKLYLSTRRGSWIMSRLGPNGIPYDIFLQKRIFEIIRYYDPIHFADTVVERFLNFKFQHDKYGLKPKHRFLSAHITINDALPNCIISGIVTVKQNVKQFTKDGVIFEGENEVTKIDTVVLATGYEIKFPFISEDILQVSETYVNLYKLIFPCQLKHPTLSFIGFTQPLGAMFPLSEAQSRWFVQLMKGNVSLPSQSVMEQEIKKRMDQKNNQFVPSLRHALEVIWIPYMDEICSEFNAKPSFWKMAFTDPKLYIACMFGPCTPYQYRLQGPHQWAGAREAILSAWERIEVSLKTFKRD